MGCGLTSQHNIRGGCVCSGKLNGGNNPLNPYVNNVNASNVAAQIVQAGSAATGLAR